MEQQDLFNDTFFAMGRRCDVVFTGFENDFAQPVFHLLKTEMATLENSMSRFVENSPIAKLNRAKKNVWRDVDPEIWDILTIAYDFYQMSNGAFDIAAGQLFSLYTKSAFPTAAELEKAKKTSGFDKVEFDFHNHKIRFREDGVEFDLGAIDKGIALDWVKPILQKHGVENAIVSFDERSILALGKTPYGENWPLGIRDHFNTNDFIHVFSASNEAVTTSGTVFLGDGEGIEPRWNIVSPATGLPVKGKKLVSVKSESATLGEFLSTVLLILPEDDGILMTEKIKQVEILEVEYSERNGPKTKLSIL